MLNNFTNSRMKGLRPELSFDKKKVILQFSFNLKSHIDDGIVIESVYIKDNNDVCINRDDTPSVINRCLKSGVTYTYESDSIEEYDEKSEMFFELHFHDDVKKVYEHVYYTYYAGKTSLLGIVQESYDSKDGIAFYKERCKQLERRATMFEALYKEQEEKNKSLTRINKDLYEEVGRYKQQRLEKRGYDYTKSKAYREAVKASEMPLYKQDF